MPDHQDDDSAVKKAVSACGGADALALHFEINRTSVYDWIRLKRVPSDRAPHVARLAREKTGEVFQLSALCPPVPWDIAVAEHQAAAAILAAA